LSYILLGKLFIRKAAVASRVTTAASLAPLAPDSRLAHAAHLLTASRTPPSPRPLASLAPPSRPPRSEAIDARVRRRLVPLAARPSPSRRATVSAPVSRRSLPPPVRRRRRRAARRASGPSVVSAQWHPVKFYYFLISSIHCKFKKLCRIHLNSENYETNFVGKV
jgi:hypothetical protein